MWGTYQSILIYSDIYTALTTSPTSSLAATVFEGKCGGNSTSFATGVPADCGFGELPLWLVSIYLVGNTALSLLNFYWFSQMIKAVRKRFVAPAGGKADGTAKKAQ